MTAQPPCAPWVGTGCRSYSAPSLHLFRYHQCPGDCAARRPPTDKDGKPVGPPNRVITITREYLQP